MRKSEIIFSIIAAVCLVVLFSPFASKHPDGLEKISRDKGFAEKTLFTAGFPGYLFPGIKNKKISVMASGALGVIIVFCVTYLFGRLTGKLKKR